MKNYLFNTLLLLVLAPPGYSQVPARAGGVGGSAFHKNDITYSIEVVTPHIPWAVKLPGGPIKGFFIPSIRYGRDMVELMQRLSLAPTTVSIDRSWDINCWGIGDYYGHEYRGDRDDFRTVYGYVEKDLTGDAPFEVMVIPGLNGWSRLTRPTRDAILRRVREGAGLILLHPFVGDVEGHPFKGDEPIGDQRVWDISPLTGVANDTINDRGYPEINQDAVTKGRWESAQPHFITEGLPLDLLPEGGSDTDGGAFYKYRAAGDVLIKSGPHPLLAVRNFGKGRVVAFAYVEEGFTPRSVNPIETKIYWDYWEYHYSLLARSILWAAGRADSLPRITSLAAGGRDDSFLKLSLAADAPRQISVEITGANEFGRQLPTHTLHKDLAAGANTIEVAAGAVRPAEGWSGGRQIFNVIVRDRATGATLNWGAATYQVPKRAVVTAARPAVDVYQQGETLSAVLRATGDFNDLQLRMKVSDDRGRLLAVMTKPARGERTFSYRLRDFIGKYAHITAELVTSGGAVVDQLRAKPVLVVPHQRRAKEYTALVSFGGTKHYWQDTQMRMVRAVAADTGFTWGEDVDNSLNIPRGTFGVYWYDRGPTTPEGMEKAIADFNGNGDFDALGYLTKKELYRRTGDVKFLRRTPSFNDPAFMRTLADIVRATARNKARYRMDYYFVGDEGSLTSYGDPVDFDWSPEALADFREWLKTEYGTLTALNKVWRTKFTKWAEVVPYTTLEARQSGSFAPWADHRTFMEITFARAYRIARDAVIEGDPDGHIAVSGTQETNAYNGADWYRLDQVIDDFLSYAGGNQWDLHRSFAKPDAMIGFWTGYGSHGVAVQNAIWTAAIHNVLYPNIFWMYSFLDPDLTYSKSARDMGAAFTTLKFAGIGKLLMESERQQDGIAIHYSMPSVHGASILGYHQNFDGDESKARDTQAVNFPANRDGWVRVIKDLGLQFDFVAAEQIEQGLLRSGKYRVLVLPLSLAVSREEAVAIEAFVREGGMVIADAGTGIMDEHCAWQFGKGMLDDLFGIASPSTAAGAGMRPSTSQRRLGAADGTVVVTREGRAPEWGLSAEALAELTAAEAGVRAAGGTPLARIGAADAVITRQVGKGWAVYLNSLLTRYAKLRGEVPAGGKHYRAAINSLLARAGVSPAVAVFSADGKRITQAQVARYRFGAAEVVTIVKENAAVEGIVGRDGVTAYTDGGLGKVARQEITIKLPRKSYVTDIRSGKSFDYTDVVRTPVIIGDAVVLGLSQSKQALKVSGPRTAGLGTHPEFTIASSAPEKRLLRCHVLAPDGSPIMAYSKNLLVEGATTTYSLPAALNDPAGRYTLRVTDVVTGASAEATITLR